MSLPGTTVPRFPAVGLSLLWFVVALLLGWSGVFATPPGVPPVALGLAAGLPPLAALGVLAGSASARRWARTRDLQLLTGVQAWRAGGLAFVALGMAGDLPLGFALPAGFGDAAVGLTAPFVALLLARGSLRTSAYLAWTAFGVLDLLLAVTLGVLYTMDPTPGTAGTALMAQLPMSIVPTFFVPLLLIVHIVSVAAMRAARPRSAGATPLAGAGVTGR